MPEYLSPGVYVEEYESGSVPMEGVGTSTAGFVGFAEKGTVIGKPQLVTSFSDYLRIYGGYLSETKFGEKRYLPYAVEHFFINGGSRAFVMRVCPADAKCAETKSGSALSFRAVNPGEWGNRIKVTVSPVSRVKTQVYEVDGNNAVVRSTDGFTIGDVVRIDNGESPVYNRITAIEEKTVTFENPVDPSVVDTNLVPTKFIRSSEIDVSVKYGEVKEDYLFVSLNTESADYIASRMAKSELVAVKLGGSDGSDEQSDAEEASDSGESGDESESSPSEMISPFEAIGGKGDAVILQLTGGTDGNIAGVTAAEYIGTDEGPGRRTGIQAFIENSDVSLMAVPGVTMPEVQMSLIAHCENLKSRFAVLDMPKDRKKTDELIEYRDMFDSHYAAFYHPWLQIFDPVSKKNIIAPPSASVLGIYARTDNTVGVHKAPANEVVRACTGLSVSYNTAEQDLLNPKGINLIRSFPGRGIRVWGARTATSNGSWKYINVRRLFIYLEESIRVNTNWVVFESNTEALWERVKRTIEMFLASTWRSGALAGATTAEAFFVEVGRSTMTQDDIDNGRLICVIGVAPVKPAEFVIFRIGQYTSESNG
ncbi:MAG: phage tail sheath subtilisin-like domain-containing protein [Oscillospiraceae bacterium]|nr:phage tail sheath subtilisin-like domain-containing protein [Oscillospiraceae bacterium]